MRPTPSALFSTGPVAEVDVSLGPTPMPDGYKEVEMRLQTMENGHLRLSCVHLLISATALEQMVRGLRAVKNNQETKK
jgi:hypothetical protein